jgi:transcriptional regulator GlxA family with amidase domain
MKIVIVAFDHFTDIDVFLPWDLLNRVKFRHKEWDVKILGTQPTHLSANGIDLPVHGNISECNTADVVFFASGRGAREVIKDPDYLKQFKLDPEKQIICSMCSGALILAALGLLDGLTATTYPTTVSLLQSYGVDAVQEPLVIHGNIATAAGCLAALKLVSWIIVKKLNAGIMDEVMASVQPVGQGLECIY